MDFEPELDPNDDEEEEWNDDEEEEEGWFPRMVMGALYLAIVGIGFLGLFGYVLMGLVMVAQGDTEGGTAAFGRGIIAILGSVLIALIIRRNP